jgi:hypothetical protein
MELAKLRKSGNIAGMKRSLARVVGGGRSLLFGFSKRTHLAKSDPVSQICKLNLNQFHYRPEEIFCAPVRNSTF